MRDTACEYSTNDSCNWLDIYEYAFFFLEYASVFPEIFLRAFFVMNILNIPQSTLVSWTVEAIKTLYGRQRAVPIIVSALRRRGFDCGRGTLAPSPLQTLSSTLPTTWKHSMVILPLHHRHKAAQRPPPRSASSSEAGPLGPPAPRADESLVKPLTAGLDGHPLLRRVEALQRLPIRGDCQSR